MYRFSVFCLICLLLPFLGCNRSSSGGRARVAKQVGDTPAIPEHVKQSDIESGKLTLEEILEIGKILFGANFNDLDGARRPETTGTGEPRERREGVDSFNRISAPDANSCAGCHNLPRIGGGGDIVNSVFVLGQRFPFVNFDETAGDNFENHTLKGVANERNTLGMFGAGFVELLAREMSEDLEDIRGQAIADAEAGGADVTVSLDTKGVNFGSITAHPDGSLDTSGVEGVDADLVIKPFHQKGVVVSLRQFTNNAMNHHHGMQTEERFGVNVDADDDGHVNELTVGDVTAATLFQATLPVPGQVLPSDGAAQDSVQNGKVLFETIGCADCHVPALKLDGAVFTEPNPFNPAGNLLVAEVSSPFAVDLLTEGPGPHLNAESDGTVMVPLFSDLKRHDLGADEMMNNEELVQGGVPTSEFITRKLWGFASEPPFLHHGKVTLISEAILKHGGEALAARTNFEALAAAEQADVVEFLKTLQILPEGSTGLLLFANGSGVIGDEPSVTAHLDQADIDDGSIGADQLFEHGKKLFSASWNKLDGQGRPETTGTGDPRSRREGIEAFNRISAPDANSCAGCHNVPRTGAGGDNVANVFVLGQRLPFVNFDGGAGDGNVDQTLKGVANERNTLGMFGSGYIELLAREMSTELQQIRDDAIADATSGGSAVTVDLITKGVDFGSLTANPDGSVDTSEVEGVDADLIIKPFHQKGVVVSLRQFTNNAMNHHHGIQTAERFGDGTDPDNDGFVDEMTDGDTTAVAIYQALLAVPGRVSPKDQNRKNLVRQGGELFDAIGCTDCHIPSLKLDDPVFTEPNPFNPAGNLRVGDVPQPFAADLTTQAKEPRLERENDGSVMVPAFTDLKRHDMGDELDNELLVQAGVPTNEHITRKLWGFANEPPFMHHGRALLISEAILLHGGEAQTSRDTFERLGQQQKNALIEYLKTLQVLPEGTTELEVEEE